jgi:hypothetical protein
MVRERLGQIAAAGITTIRVAPTGNTSDDMIANLEFLTDIVQRLGN